MVFANREADLEIIEGDLVVVDNKQGDFYRAEVLDIFKVIFLSSIILRLLLLTF